jgi:hypothetical protein
MKHTHVHTQTTLPFHLVLQNIHRQKIINKNTQGLRIPKTLLLQWYLSLIPLTINTHTPLKKNKKWKTRKKRKYNINERRKIWGRAFFLRKMAYLTGIQHYFACLYPYYYSLWLYTLFACSNFCINKYFTLLLLIVIDPAPMSVYNLYFM